MVVKASVEPTREAEISGLGATGTESTAEAHGVKGLVYWILI